MNEKELIKDIKSLDKNAKIILRQSMLIGLVIVKKQEKTFLKVIELIDKEG